MKRPFLISLFLVVCQLSFGQTGTIEGKLFDTRENRAIIGGNVWLENTKIGSATDIHGRFRIDSIPFGKYNLRVSYVGIGDTTLKDLEVSTSTPIDIRVEFPLHCIYDNQGHSKKCPVCKKSDKVVPIVYGLPIGNLDKKHNYYAGCTITYCDPDWYCKRDKYKFGRRKRK